MARCTILKFFGLQNWFDARFLYLCEAHDAAYETRIWKDKLAADFILAAGFVNRGYITIGLLSLPYTLILGSLFWLWKKYACKS